MSRQMAVEQRRYVARIRDTQGWQFWNLINYTRIENVHKVHKKTLFLLFACYIYYCGDSIDTDLCEPLLSIFLYCQEMTKLEVMRILQAQVCHCISAHTGLPHQKKKREIIDASKS